MAAIAERLSVRAPEDWGVQPVPIERRALRAFDFAVLWGDLAVSLLVMVAGTLLVPGLGTQQAILVIIIGTALGTVLLALAGMIGTNTGVPTMVALRAPFGVRGSYLASGLNILQLVGWAALEIIIMAQAAEALSDEYLGFGGYYLWIAFFGVAGTLMAMGGPILVVREWLQKFGVWVVIGASAWLTWHCGFPNFFQGIDLVIALPVSWLPLVCDYNRFGRRAGSSAVGTYIGYAIANAWFFALGMLYVQALQSDPGGFINSLVTMLLPMALGWLALIVLLVGETDEAFANIYSTAVSIQNLASKLKVWLLALAVGIVATVAAANLDLIGYETFLLLIGGVFVPVFGILLADYFVLRGRDYAVEELYRQSGAYWYAAGLNPVAITVWLCRPAALAA
ncbi:MAG: putative hydroxymethylpyrimidine transporter CytX [Chloroflexi bacterium]|nr:MAG: putative hydroxymethylpyrimidine transporter CytX [Chloroflexota bacterium]